MFNFAKLNTDLMGVTDWLLREYGLVRTGRATPHLLDGVLVDSYGAKSSITHIASISIEDPRTLRVTPWDK